MREVRHAVGLRPLSMGLNTTAAETKTALPSFKQYRDKDGLFYFKFVDPKGLVLLQSLGYASPKDAGQTIAKLLTEGPAHLNTIQDQLESVDAVLMDLFIENWPLMSTSKPAGQK